MTYRELYTEGYAALDKGGVEEASLDARLLLEYVCGTSRNDLLVHGERSIAEEQAARYRQLLERRARRIPLQQLTGQQEFMGLTFRVNEHVLIPRQDTEILVEEVLRELHDGMRVLDLCTGSGCILLSLLHYSNGCSGVGADISEEALEVARENAEQILGKADRLQPDAGVDSTAVQLICSDLFEQVRGQFEFIVSNPPYIPSRVIDTLAPEVKDHEPRLALDGAEDGLLFYRRIAEESPRFLVSGGMLYFEIGYDQAESVSRLMQNAGFSQIHVVKDYAGLDRVVYGTYFRTKKETSFIE